MENFFFTLLNIIISAAILISLFYVLLLWYEFLLRLKTLHDNNALHDLSIYISISVHPSLFYYVFGSVQMCCSAWDPTKPLKPPGQGVTTARYGECGVLVD